MATGAFTPKYQRFPDRKGEPFTLLGKVDQASFYRIQLEDGFVTEAWPEEIESALDLNCKTEVTKMTVSGTPISPRAKGTQDFGDWRVGRATSAISQLEVGYRLLSDSMQFDARNICEVTKVDLQRGVAYARFIDPLNPGQLRSGADPDGFAIWDHELQAQSLNSYSIAFESQRELMSMLGADLDTHGIKHFGVGWTGARNELLRAVSEDENTQGMLLAVIGKNHFGNPIPQEWYSAAREFLDSCQDDIAEEAPACVAQSPRG